MDLFTLTSGRTLVSEDGTTTTYRMETDWQTGTTYLHVEGYAGDADTCPVDGGKYRVIEWDTSDFNVTHVKTALCGHVHNVIGRPLFDECFGTSDLGDA